MESPPHCSTIAIPNTFAVITLLDTEVAYMAAEEGAMLKNSSFNLKSKGCIPFAIAGEFPLWQFCLQQYFICLQDIYFFNSRTPLYQCCDQNL
jgi:hypothetical protein